MLVDVKKSLEFKNYCKKETSYNKRLINGFKKS